MKKLVFAALAIAAMAACTKSNVQYEQPGEIAFQPVAQKATKATTSVGNAYPEAEKFNVWAWWVSAEAGHADYPTSRDGYTEYIKEGTFAKKENTWGGWDLLGNKSKPYYWPTTGSLFFAGYSPATAQGAYDYSLETQTLSIVGYTQSHYRSETTDLMWFDVTQKSYDQNDAASNGVPVEFRHALSWLTFKFNLKDENTEKLWTIKNAELQNIETKANFTAKLDQNPIWTVLETSENITVFDGEHLLEYSSDGTVLEGNGVASAMTGDVLVIPQSCAAAEVDASGKVTKAAEAQLVITYDLSTQAGTKLENQTVTLPVNTIGDKWLDGKHYIYTIIFGANEILIAPTVADWGVEYVNVPVE
ncbi:MAG: fimbrillin family protein [Bacteroidales bacterium]|nr:fimbrillin family protein [Bacteroidales bacterium]